ncbi:MAG: hypothetical protein HY726_06270 [Candidatus Rokubacteria bacterium]|nr:hypothetical protein [Candidatus Rokubacteria bacterium]
MKLTANGVRIIVGEDDPGTPVGMARVIQERIRGAEPAVLPNAAQCSCNEAAKEFNEVPLAFLARLT